jgi:hypothetical protein
MRRAGPLPQFDEVDDDAAATAGSQRVRPAAFDWGDAERKSSSPASPPPRNPLAGIRGGFWAALLPSQRPFRTAGPLDHTQADERLYADGSRAGAPLKHTANPLFHAFIVPSAEPLGSSAPDARATEAQIRTWLTHSETSRLPGLDSPQASPRFTPNQPTSTNSSPVKIEASASMWETLENERAETVSTLFAETAPAETSEEASLPSHRHATSRRLGDYRYVPRHHRQVEAHLHRPIGAAIAHTAAEAVAHLRQGHALPINDRFLGVELPPIRAANFVAGQPELHDVHLLGAQPHGQVTVQTPHSFADCEQMPARLMDVFGSDEQQSCLVRRAPSPLERLTASPSRLERIEFDLLLTHAHFVVL